MINTKEIVKQMKNIRFSLFLSFFAKRKKKLGKAKGVK